MESYEDHLQRAGDALQALADGPGRAAAEALEQAFGQAGERIEGALSRAAKSGELDFRTMAQSVLADLARIAAEAALARTGAGQALTVNVAMHGHADTSSGVGTRAELSKVVAQAVAKGGRFW